jgi:hypothetical protein
MPVVSLSNLHKVEDCTPVMRQGVTIYYLMIPSETFDAQSEPRDGHSRVTNVHHDDDWLDGPEAAGCE